MFVIITYLSINSVLSVSENCIDKSQQLSVFFLTSDCPRGYFGDECSDKCSDNCYGCNNINGVCDSGCKPGWGGEYCHEG